MRRFLGGFLCLMLLLLTSCGGEAEAPSVSQPSSNTESTVPSTQVTQPAEPLLPSWAEFDTVMLQPFIPEELQEAYDTA